MTSSSNNGIIVQTYQGRLFASRPPTVNIKNGIITAAIIPMSATVRVLEASLTLNKRACIYIDNSLSGELLASDRLDNSREAEKRVS